jgi:hypothetical protein
LPEPELLVLDAVESGRVELFSSHDGLKPRHERLQFSKHAISTHGTLVATPTSNEEGVSKHLT